MAETVAELEVIGWGWHVTVMAEEEMEEFEAGWGLLLEDKAGRAPSGPP